MQLLVIYIDLAVLGLLKGLDKIVWLQNCVHCENTQQVFAKRL